MRRIEKMFAALHARGEMALITYITAGDPDMTVTEDVLRCLVENGADMIELGIPFSDPMADGPTIQAASQRALKNPFSLERIFEAVKSLRNYSGIPLILFGYYNPFFHYGLERLARDAKEAGVDGFLVVDLPPEEAGDFKKAAASCGLDIIFLLAPTSTDERMKLVAKVASGFIYYISVTGVTGARESLAESMDSSVEKIRKFSSLPVGVGFGVSTPEHVKNIAGYADAVIIGSALIKVLEENMGRPDMLKKTGQYIRSLKDATRLSR